ncbi:MAG: ABC transporter substrate-binding protein [Brotaphodocola sp.]
MLKRKRKISGLLLGLSVLFLSGCASSAQNAPKESTASQEEPMEIACTSVAICKILDALGYDYVVGVPESSGNIPERYADAKTIGAAMNPDLEILKSISPDLVLSPQTLESSLSESYRAAGITSAFLDLSSVESMYQAITSLGELLGCEKAAEELNAEYHGFMDEYRNHVEKEQDILLLMAFPDGFYLIATENSYVGSLIKMAGGNNVYGSDYKGDENGFVNINPEDMIQKEPDRIFVFAHYAEEEAFAFMQKDFAENSIWQYFDAVKEEKITYLPSKYFGMSATLSWTEALDYLAPVFQEGK